MMPSTTSVVSSNDTGPSRDEMEEDIQNQPNVVDTNTEKDGQGDVSHLKISEEYNTDEGTSVNGLMECIQLEDRPKSDTEAVDCESDEKEEEKVDEEKVDEERVEVEKVEEEETVDIEKVEEEIVEVEKVAEETVEVEKVAEETVEVEKVEEEKVDIEKVEEEIVEVEKVEEEETVDVEKVEEETVDIEKVEEEKVDVEKVEEETVDIEKVEEEETVEVEKVEEEKVDVENVEEETVDIEKVNEETVEVEILEEETVEVDKVEVEKVKEEKVEVEKVEEKVEEEIFEEEEEEEEEIVVTQDAPVFSLVIELFYKIMDYLPVRDCVKMEGVCKLWRERGIEHWRMRKSLEIKNLCSVGVTERLTDSHMIAQFKKSSPRIKTLNLLHPAGRCFGTETLTAIGDGMVNLDSLKVYFTRSTDQGIKELARRRSGLKNLEMNCENWCPAAEFDHATFDDRFGAVMRETGGLTQLKLTGCVDVMDMSFQDLNKNLTSLSLNNCEKLTDKAVYDIMMCPKLRSLSLTRCFGQLTNASFSYIAEGSNPSVPSKLESLELIGAFKNAADCHGLSELKKCRTLKRLLIEYSNLICDDSLITISKGCTDLEELSISHCFLDRSNLTEHGFREVSRNCDKLTSLSLNYCYKVTDKIVTTFALLGRLKVFNARFTAMTERGVRVLLQHCPMITHIGVELCQNINVNTIENLGSDMALDLNKRGIGIIVGSESTGSTKFKWDGNGTASEAYVGCLKNIIGRDPSPHLQLIYEFGCVHMA